MEPKSDINEENAELLRLRDVALEILYETWPELRPKPPEDSAARIAADEEC